MASRVVTGSAITCACVTVAVVWFRSSGGSIEPIDVQPSFEGAHPCLLSVERCADLSQTPFAPCLVSVERCNQDWTVVPLPLSGRSYRR